MNAFVVRARRARLIEFLQSLTRRDKALARLDHFQDFDPRFVVETPSSQQRSATIAKLLHERGAPPDCHVISYNSALDGRSLPPIEALDEIVGFGPGTLISCIPGRLGYFEGEGPKDRFILQRPAVS